MSLGPAASIPRRVAPVLMAFLVACASTRAHALVVQGAQSMPRPPAGFIGRYNGSSGTPIAPQWLISAKHCGGGVGSGFQLRGENYTVIEAVQHATMDLQLLKVDRVMPGWHALAVSASVGQRVVLAGFGITAGAPLAGNTGYDWSGPRLETWGENRISFASSSLGTTFEAPGHANALPYESQPALNDSGGALFVADPNGTLRLAGVIVSVSGYGSAAYGSAGYSVSLTPQPVQDWIRSIVGPLSIMTHDVASAPANGTSASASPAARAATSPLPGVARRAAREDRRTPSVVTMAPSRASTPAPTPSGTVPPSGSAATGANRAARPPAPEPVPASRNRARGTERRR
jgi:hypothetical protein